MGRIALTPCDIKSRGIYLTSRKIPENYMSDFTVLGFVVDRYQEALSLLLTAGFQVDELETGADIRIQSSDQLMEINSLFSRKGLNFEFSDIADTLYQA